ncbi:hypothetical protein JCM14469_27980 [Desulfatiferula olefinivorans]
MELATLFKRSPGGKSGVHALYLDHLRFIRLLENARALMTLREDGKDKAGGEYILDVHYVTALAEEMIRTLGVLVFDACVLCTPGGEVLYKRYDREQARVRALLTSVRHRVDSPAARDGEDPEYRLLKDVLGWFDRERGDSVMGFIGEIVGHVMGRTVSAAFPVDRTPSIDLPGSGARHRIHLLPVGPAEVLPDYPSLEQIGSRPLQALLRDRQGAPSDGDVTRWAGIVSGPSLSLIAGDGDRIARQVEARLSGERETDYLFVFTRDTRMQASLIDAGLFNTMPLREGGLAWCYNRPAAETDNAFARLGSLLFASTQGA